jgi:hypothetical protein
VSHGQSTDDLVDHEPNILPASSCVKHSILRMHCNDLTILFKTREAPTASAETLLENMCVQVLGVVVHVGYGQIRAKVCATYAKVGLFV